MPTSQGPQALNARQSPAQELTKRSHNIFRQQLRLRFRAVTTGIPIKIIQLINIHRITTNNATKGSTVL